MAQTSRKIRSRQRDVSSDDIAAEILHAHAPGSEECDDVVILPIANSARTTSTPRSTLVAEDKHSCRHLLQSLSSAISVTKLMLLKTMTIVNVANCSEPPNEETDKDDISTPIGPRISRRLMDKFYS